MSDAHRSGLNWSYLSSSIGGHFGPVGRLLYWMFAHTAPLNYDLTVAFRVGAQAVATYLLWRLLVLLIGDRPAAVLITGLYAASPRLVASLAWLTSGIGLAPAQVFFLIALRQLILFARTGSLRNATVCTAFTALSVLTSDVYVAVLYALPALAVGFCYRGSLLDRVRALGRQLPGWAIIAAPLAAYAVYFLSTTAKAAHPQALSAMQALRLVRDEWLNTVGPSIVGGPWRWFNDGNNYVGFAAPSVIVQTAGQVTVAVLVSLGIRRSGVPRTAVAWSLPAFIAAASVLLVGLGRFATYGPLIPITPRYAFAIPMTLALALALSLCPELPPPTEGEGSAAGTDAEQPEVPRGTRAICCALLVISSALSSIRFIDRFSDNPTSSYVHNLVDDARKQGRAVNLYDTAVPEAILSAIEPHHHVSDLLDLANVPARFDVVSTPAMVVDSHGHIGAAGFLAAATGVGIRLPSCGFYLSGAGSWRIALSRPLPKAEWFLRLSLYQTQPSTIHVSFEDSDGTVLGPVGGSDVSLPTTLAQVDRRLPVAAPDAVRISTTDRQASICLSEVAVGGPTSGGTP